MITKDELLEIKEKIDLGLENSNSQEFSDFLEKMKLYEHNPQLQKRYAESLDIHLENEDKLELTEKFLKKKDKDIAKNFLTLFLVTDMDSTMALNLASLSTSQNDDSFFLLLLSLSVITQKQLVDNANYIKQMKYFEKLNKQIELKQLDDSRLERYVDQMLNQSKVENSQYAYNDNAKPYPLDTTLKPFMYLSDKQKAIVSQVVHQHMNNGLELNSVEKSFLKDFEPGEKTGPNQKPSITPKMQLKN